MIPGSPARPAILLGTLGSIINAVQRKRALWGEFSWVVIGQAASVLGAIVGVKLLTGALPPNVYGELALAMTAATLVNQITITPLSNAFLRFFSAASEAGEFGPYLKTMAMLTIGGCAVGLAFAPVGIVSLALIGNKVWIPLLIATLIFAVVCANNSMMEAIQCAARHRSVVALHQGAASWLRFGCALAAVSVLGIGSTSAMWGYCLGALFVVASQACFFKRKIIDPATKLTWGSSRDTELWRSRIIAYAWPFSIWGIFAWLQLSSDRWALEVFGSTKDVGLYSVVYQLGYYPLAMLAGLSCQFLAPLLFQWAGNGKDKTARALVSRRNRLITILALCITACCFLGATVLHRLVFRFLTAEEYRSVSWLLPIAALSGGLFGTAQITSLGLLGNHNSALLLRPKVYTALLGTVLNFCGAAMWGLVGVITAGVVANGMCVVWMMRMNVVPAPSTNVMAVGKYIQSVSDCSESLSAKTMDL